MKYDARAQRELPVHCDQSEWSFTISLNSVEEYEGGGTWFEDLEATMRPDAGDRSPIRFWSRVKLRVRLSVRLRLRLCWIQARDITLYTLLLHSHYFLSCFRGGVVSFPGSLFHAGAPITQGLRYIIAAFMYLDNGEEDATGLPGIRAGATGNASSDDSSDDDSDEVDRMCNAAIGRRK